MKRLFVMLMAVTMFLPAMNAQNKQIEKAVKKEVKQKLKELKKGGYEIFGSSRTLETALTKHYTVLETEGDKVIEIPGFATAKSHNVAAAAAQNSAATRYSAQASAQVKGRILSDMASDVANHEAEFDKFYAVYEAKVEQEIRGELRPSFSVKKDNPDGTISVQSYFIVNDDAASRARINAFKNSQAESKAAQEYAQRISNFVNERVVPED